MASSSRIIVSPASLPRSAALTAAASLVQEEQPVSFGTSADWRNPQFTQGFMYNGTLEQCGHYCPASFQYALYAHSGGKITFSYPLNLQPGQTFEIDFQVQEGTINKSIEFKGARIFEAKPDGYYFLGNRLKSFNPMNPFHLKIINSDQGYVAK